MSSRRTVLKPGSEKVRLYVPPRSWLIRYVPSASVVAVRTFSIRSGLAASTVTPGSTPPDASLTTPVMVAWARATEGANTSNPATATQIAQTWRMNTPRNGTLGVRIGPASGQIPVPAMRRGLCPTQCRIGVKKASKTDGLGKTAPRLESAAGIRRFLSENGAMVGDPAARQPALQGGATGEWRQPAR